MRPPVLLRGPYVPPVRRGSRLRGEGDVDGARRSFYERPRRNLTFMLRDRYAWMDEYLPDGADVIEVGSGAGLAREFIAAPRLRLTDVELRPWIDVRADALALPFGDGSLDAVISSHVIHHLATPTRFFREAHRVLRPGGYLLVHDVHTSLMLRAMLRVLRHEGWSYEVDVSDPHAVVNDPADPWSANNAVPEMLFSDPGAFEAANPGLRVLRNEPCECLVVVAAGGVVVKGPTVQLPERALRWLRSLDRALVALAPSVFALSRRVVIQKA